ncbi:MAG: heme o synthase [Sandaracinaceae bacterium]
MSSLARPDRRLADRLRDLVLLTKPRITFMVVLTAAGGMWLAPGAMAPARALGTLVALALVVSAASVLNCWLERDVDRHMSRTRTRPLPDGRLSPGLALGFGLGLGVLGVPLLTLASNPLTGALGAIALFSYVAVYTPLKRVSPIALVVGAVPGALPPLMGWTAATGELGAPGLVLFAILFFWQLPHFLAIALVREREYADAGIRVLPAVRGRRVTVWHTVAWAALLLPVSLLLVPAGAAGGLYLVVATGLGLAFLAWAARGLAPEAGRPWAKRLFVASLAYLPLLLLGLALDVALLR